MDIDREAPVVVEVSMIAAASLETVWRLQTDIDRWPTWQHDIEEAHLAGPISAGSTVTWRTHGLSLTSVIGDLHPMRRIAWGGSGQGIDGIHVWTFDAVADGVRVHTAESWDGPPVIADPDGMRSALASSLTAWLAALTSVAETTH
ncbi:SRPBCC family protein [Micromonospora okii]|uniref:SRPBCC family protein n=1 Tax=Micromonospora okii TaxID=1182970 RepID=UPI001E5A1CC0|nr:SRPBCC family protein [Micromonospora okii]